MIDKKPESFSDIVDRAAEELRSMPVPPGPPPKLLDALLQAAKVNVACVQRTMDIDNAECVQRTLEASDQPSSDGSYYQPLSQLQKIRNIIMKNPIKSITTLAACCLVLIAAYLIVAPLMQGNVAFAEFSAIIQKAKTMVCTGRINMPFPGGMNVNMNIKIMNLDSGQIRQEMSSQIGSEIGSSVMIMDFQAGKMLSLTPATKSAFLLNIKGQPKSAVRCDWLAVFKKIIQNSKAEDLGPKTMNGKEVKGFRFKDENQSITFWADVESGVPVTVEIQMKIPDITNIDAKGERTMEFVYSDFQFDVPLDESLFSLTPPEGYKLQEMDMNMDFSGAGEKDVIVALRILTDMDNGDFPDSINGMSLGMKLSFYLGKQSAIERGMGKTPQNEISQKWTKKGTEIGGVFGRMGMFLAVNKGWKYAGKGVKLGDAQTPVFWYVPKDSKQGRVVYGDLSARDVPVDQLPPDPEAKKSDTK
ncbi:MAG: hypothetical protein ABSA77_00585 [Thermoguttaceae bacterium]|jgi:outer membrane lipoprotein-sorting protein